MNYKVGDILVAKKTYKRWEVIATNVNTTNAPASEMWYLLNLLTLEDGLYTFKKSFSESYIKDNFYTKFDMRKKIISELL